MAGITGSCRGGMLACDIAMAFAGVTSRGLPRVLIKIMSESSHVLILGVLKIMPTPLHAHGRWGKGLSSFVFDCVGGMCICGVWLCVCVCESVMQQLFGRRQRFLGGSWISAEHVVSVVETLTRGICSLPLHFNCTCVADGFYFFQTYCFCVCLFSSLPG